MLAFENVRLLTYTHTPVFLDAGLRYRIEKQLSLEGTLLDRTTQTGVSKIIQKENNIISGANDYDSVYLNGVFFGSGIVSNIRFNGGTMVRRDDYTYDITCYEDGNLFNALSGVYSGLSWDGARLIESLSESFDFEEDKAGNKNYNHSVAIKYSNYASVASGINLSKVAASNFFNSTAGLGAFLGNYTSVGNIKKLYTENYNLIDCNCSFSETVSIPAIRDGNYSYQLSYSVEQDQEGFVNVTEDLSIQGVIAPKYAGAVQGYNSLRGASYTRANAVYAAYNFSNTALFTQPISQSTTQDKFRGSIELSNVYSNNPKYLNSAIWEYTTEISRDEENYYTVSEQGSIRGFGRPTVEKYQNALAFYNTYVKGPSANDVDDRLAALYATTSRALPLTLIGQTSSKNESDGTIEYSYTKTDNSQYTTGNFKKREIDVTTVNPVHWKTVFPIFNYKEIVQTQQQTTLGERSISIHLKGQRGLAIDTYMTEAKTLAATYIPAEVDTFLSSAQYSFTPNLNDFTLQVDYTFPPAAPKLITDLTID